MTATDICAPLRNGSWSHGGVGAFATSFSDPGATVAHFVSWALEYVSPLNDWLDQLIGDEGRVSSFAATWRGVVADLAEDEETLRTSDQRIALLQGKTSRAMRKLHDEIRGVLGDAAEWSSATAAALELASTIVAAVHDAVIGALSELAGLVTSLFGFTLNPFDKVDDLRRLSNRALAFIEVIAELIERMFDAFEELIALLRSLVPLIQEGLQVLRERLGVLIRNVSPAGGFIPGILGGAVSDLLAGDPRVTELDPNELTEEQRTAWEKANGVDSIDDFAALIRMNGLVDDMGQGDRSVVDIMEVVDTDGNTHYMVALPSTQDWGMLKGLFPGGKWEDMLADYPPTNDLDSNVALMLMDNPWMATQYERAVTQAMSDAGVPPGADVVYTGFSQGGIMAATLASNQNSPYNVVGVVTNGSPIGGFPIPEGVEVYRFEHQGDPVPHLSLDIDPQLAGTGNPGASTPLPSNEHLVPLPYPTVDGAQQTGVDQTHNNDNYETSVRQWETQNGGLPDIFGGTVVDHQQHTWGE